MMLSMVYSRRLMVGVRRLPMVVRQAMIGGRSANAVDASLAIDEYDLSQANDDCCSAIIDER